MVGWDHVGRTCSFYNDLGSYCFRSSGIVGLGLSFGRV